MKLVKHNEVAWLLKRKLCVNLSSLCCLILLTSLRTDAFESSYRPPENIELDFSKLIFPEKKTEDAPAEVGEAQRSDKFEYHLASDVLEMTKDTPEESEMHGKDEPVLLPKGKTVVTEIMAKQKDEEELKYDDGMPMEDTVSMPAIGFGMGIVPEAVKSSQVSEPFKMDLPLKSSSAEEMPVAQDSETAQAMPQFLSEDVMSVPMPPAKQDSMGKELSSPMKKADDVPSMESVWSTSAILDKEESTQMETGQMAETEPQTGDTPITGKDFLGGKSLGSLQRVVEKQTTTEEPVVKVGISEEEQSKIDEEKSEEVDFTYKPLFDTTRIKEDLEEQTTTEEPVVKVGISEEKQSKTDEKKSEEADLAYKPLFDTTHIKEDLAKDTTSEQTEHESKGEEHRETGMAESVKGSGGSEEQTIVPFIPGKVIIPTGQKSLGSVQTPVDRPASPSIVLPVSSIVAKEEEESTTVPEEPTASTVISDVEEKEEEGATEADKPTESIAISEEEDTAVAEEPTVSTAIPDVEEKKEEGASATEEPAVFMAISDIEEKKEEGATMTEEPTASTTIIGISEKEEDGAAMTKQSSASTAISGVSKIEEKEAAVAKESIASKIVSSIDEQDEIGTADEHFVQSELISEAGGDKDVQSIKQSAALITTSDVSKKDEEHLATAKKAVVPLVISSTSEKKEKIVEDERSAASGADDGGEKDVHRLKESTASTAISSTSKKEEGSVAKREEPIVSTVISDVEEKEEKGAAEADKPTVSTAVAEEEDTVVPEEPTVSTVISDVEKEEDAVMTEEPTVSTVISDVEEKEEKGATEAGKPTVSTVVAEEEDTVVPEEPTVSTVISDVEKEEDAVMTEEEDQAAISESLPGIGDEEEPVIETPSPSEDAIPSVAPIESPPTESTPDSSQEAPPPEPETTSKQEPVVDPEDVEAAEPSSPGQSLVHPEEEDQVQEEEEDQASGSSATGEDPVEWSTGATEEAPVAAKAAGPQAPTTFYPSAMGSRQQVSTLAALKEILGSAFANATNVKTDVETEEGRVAILIEEGGDLQLEGLAIGPMEGVDVLVKVAAGGELRLDDVSIRDRPQRRLRKALNGRASIKTGLLVDGGSVVSIRDSTFESATDTMIRVAGGSHLSCSGCVFSNNAGDRGGALHVRDSTLHLRSCRMTENSANTGGAVHFDASGSAADFDASVLIEDTLFSRNVARGRGAGVYTSSARAIHIVDSRFQHGSASDGGAVYIQDVRIAQIDRSHFIDNKAGVSGGGLVAKSTQTLSVLKSTFKNNEASGSFAGAGFISNCSDATFRSTNFVDNYAVEGGALANIAYSTHLSKFYLQNTQFMNNKADNLGGALLIRGDTKSEASHEDERSQSEPFLASINLTSFSGNSARKGGGVFISSDVSIDFDVKIAMQRSNFTQNKASETGGGIYCGNHSRVVLSFSKFEHNKAYKGINCAEHCGCQVNASNTVCLNQLTLLFR